MTSLSSSNDPVTIRPIGLFICLIGLFFIAYSIILRVEPVFMGQHLIEQFHIKPEDLDNLIVKYQFALMAALLFAGFIVDLVGPRTILVAAGLMATIGNYLFHNAISMTELTNSQIFIGFAHPFILIAALKLGTHWLPKKDFVLFSSFVFAILLMAAQLCRPLFNYMMSFTNWHIVVDYINLTGIVLIMFLLSTFYKITTLPVEQTNFSLYDLFAILKNRNLWLISIISLLGWTVNTFFLNWGAVYLNKTHDFLPHLAGAMITLAFCVFALSGLIMGIIARFLKHLHFLMITGYWMAGAAFLSMLYIPDLTVLSTFSLLLLISFFISVTIICYARSYADCTPVSMGSRFSLIAFITTAGNSLFAFLLAKFTSPLVSASAPAVSISWEMILSSIPIGLFIGGLLVFFLRKPQT